MTTGFVSRFIVLRPLSPDARRITDRDMGLVPCEGAGSLRTFSSAWSASSAIPFGIAGVAGCPASSYPALPGLLNMDPRRLS